jgi:Neprosin
LDIEWRRKADTGNWCIKLNGTWVGYYPSKQFLGGPLADSAPSVILEFGGENTGQAPKVQMGSGMFASDGFGIAAFQDDLRYLDTSGGSHSISGAPYITNPACYSLRTDLRPPSNNSGAFFYFGGPGLSDSSCAASTPSS